MSKPVACADCGLRDVCLPVGFTSAELDRLDTLIATHRTVHRGESLFRCGDSFFAIFAVRAGFFKTCVSLEDGRDQVTGFQMPGELLGFDGIGTDEYTCTAIALADSQVCVIHYARLDDLAREFPELRRQFHRAMSQEIVRDQGMMLMLSSMRSDERVAAFLLSLSGRLNSRGLSPSAMELHMSRQEIGTYLGLTLETVSRCFSRLRGDGVVDVCLRSIRILDEQALRKLVPVVQH